MTVSSNAETMHPDPQRRRASCVSLDGEWNFSFDDGDDGLDAGWYRDPTHLERARKIRVPFAFQWPMSGIDEQDKHSICWYSRTFPIPRINDDERILLHFQAVDYEATAWINGVQVVQHEGGHVPFECDITHALFPKLDHRRGTALLVVRALDMYSNEQPRGKQTASNKPGGIWYTNTTGIWQSVWLEVVHKHRIESRTLALVPNVDTGRVKIDVDATVPIDPDYFEIDVQISLRGQAVAATRVDPPVPIRRKATVQGKSETLVSFPDMGLTGDDDRQRATLEFSLGQGMSGQPASAMHTAFQLWSPKSPNLYDIRLRLFEVKTGRVVDELWSYFGMRKISIERGRICLNNSPYYMRCVLDQGYWPESGIAAPSDEALIKDIELTKSFGFNGSRKHMKPEAPRWLYHCDRLGLIVWAESAAAFVFTPRATRRLQNELSAIIQRDISHPCIVGWCCINECWGASDLDDEGIIGQRQRGYLESLRLLCKTLDPDRLVSVNDGWSNITSTDVLGLHDYNRIDRLEENWKNIQQNVRREDFGIFANRIWCPGHHYNGQPIICSELGGYLPPASAILEQLGQMAKIMRFAQGFTYTQLTDVMQERNGLCDYNRNPKVDPAAVKALLEIVEYDA